MSLQYYKPQKNGKGAATSFNLQSKKKAVFIQIIRQTNEFGSEHPFANGEKVTVSLSMLEIAALLNVLHRKENFNTVHKSKEFTTTINFSLYEREGIHLGYGLSIFRNEDNKENKKSFMIGFNHNEAELLKNWLIFALQKIFSAIYSENKKLALEAKKRKQETSVVEAKPKPSMSSSEGDITL